jgi:hypothetical protein
MTGKIGCCGFVPLTNRVFRIMPICVIKIDDDTNPIRNEKGFCIECKAGKS